MGEQLNLEKLLDEAFTSKPGEMLQLIERVAKILQLEKRSATSGSVRVEGGLIRLPQLGRVMVIGDLHGDIESLSFILKHSRFLERSLHGVYLVFLGDYGDRGAHSAEVLYVAMKLKEVFPGSVVLLKGNHEKPPVYPHDLPLNLEQKYGDQGSNVYSELNSKLLPSLPHAVLAEEKYLFLHGGLPEGLTLIRDLAYPSEQTLEEVLWSDPREMVGVCPSLRGAGTFFGVDVTDKVLKAVGARTLIRSHEACDGVSVNHMGKVLTLFSRKGEPYFNLYAAYLELDLSMEARTAYQLARDSYRF